MSCSFRTSSTLNMDGTTEEGEYMMYVEVEDYSTGPQIEYEVIDSVEPVDATEVPIMIEQMRPVPHGKSTLFRSIYHVGNNTEDRVTFVVRAPNVSYAITAIGNYLMGHYVGWEDLEFMLCEPTDGCGTKDIDIGYYYYWR